MPWGEQQQKNEILNTMKQRYQMIDINEKDPEKHKILEQWNVLRGEVLTIYMKKIMPWCEKQLRSRLSEMSEKFVIA